MTTATVTATDSLGISIQVGDRVRVLAWGAPVRLSDVSRVARVTGFTFHGNVRLAPITKGAVDHDPIANGRAVSPGMLGVLVRYGDNPVADGYEGNRALYEQPRCTCGGRDFPSCLCGLSRAQWVAAHPDRPVA